MKKQAQVTSLRKTATPVNYDGEILQPIPTPPSEFNSLIKRLVSSVQVLRNNNLSYHDLNQKILRISSVVENSSTSDTIPDDIISSLHEYITALEEEISIYSSLNETLSMRLYENYKTN